MSEVPLKDFIQNPVLVVRGINLGGINLSGLCAPSAPNALSLVLYLVRTRALSLARSRSFSRSLHATRHSLLWSLCENRFNLKTTFKAILATLERISDYSL